VTASASGALGWVDCDGGHAEAPPSEEEVEARWCSPDFELFTDFELFKRFQVKPNWFSFVLI
jgi:hypothetical protein